MNHQTVWRLSRDRLVSAVTAVGFSPELGELMARQLGSPKAIDRMTAYVRHGYARNMEMLVDEMLAICADTENWREKKESQEAQAKYNAYLYERRMNNDGLDE